VQECVVHLVRASLRSASRAHWSAIGKALRVVCTAPTIDVVEARFAEFDRTLGAKYFAIIRLWRATGMADATMSSAATSTVDRPSTTWPKGSRTPAV
jgi:transposase-like protein